MTWLSDPLWLTQAWSVLGYHTRTNDVEGWHHHINQKVKKGELSFYVLLQPLHEELKQGNIHVHLISEAS